MADAEPIQQYLIGLGFNLDMQGFRRFNQMLAETGKGFLILGERSLAVATAVGLAVERVASNYENLFYLSQRTGASVANLQATAYGFTQIGLSAGDAKSMVDGLAMALRTNPGNGALLQLLGVGPGNANDQALKLVESLSHKPFYVASQYASMFGISPQQLLMMEQNLPELQRAQSDHIARLKEAGLSTDQLAGKSHKFMVDLRRLEDEFGIIKDVIGNDFIRPADWVINELEWLAVEFTKADKATDHWMSTVGALVGALGALAAMKKSLGWLLGLFGVKGAETAAAASGAGLGAGGTTAAIVAGGVSGALVGGLAGLSAIKHDMETGNHARSWLRSKLGLADPHESSVWLPGHAAGENWWNGARYAHAVERLEKEAGLSPLGAKALVARWAFVEAPNGPGSVNPDSGAFGIGQWLGARQNGIYGDTDFDDQISHAIHELKTSEKRAASALRYAGTASDAARGASMYERAEGYNAATGFDNYTNAVASRLSNIAPLGSDASASGGSVNLSQNTNITVNGSDDPKQTANHVLKGQAGVNADLVRNAGNTVR